MNNPDELNENEELENEELENQEFPNEEENSNDNAEIKESPNEEEALKIMVSTAGKKVIGKASKKALQYLLKNPYVLAGIAAICFLFLIIIVTIMLSNELKVKYDYIAPKCSNVNIHFNHRENADFTLEIEDYVKSMVYSLTKDMDHPERVLYQAIAVIVRTNAQYLNECTLTVTDEVDETYQFKILEETNERYTEISRVVEEYVPGLVMVENNQIMDVDFDSFCYQNKSNEFYTLYNTYSGRNIPTSWASKEISSYQFRNCSCSPGTKRSKNKENDCWIEEKFSYGDDRDSNGNHITWYRYVDGGTGKGFSTYTAYYLSDELGYNDDEMIRFFYPGDWEYHTIIKQKNSENNSNNSFAFGSSGCMWWPIGSEETTSSNGIIYASGIPASTRITSSFGLRDVSSISGASSNHPAIDIGGTISGAKEGVYNIIAAASGTVTTVTKGCVAGNSSCGGGLGNYVLIKHDDGTETRYGHMYSVSVQKGDRVKQGQVIGKMGNTGISSGTHLDFQVRVNGNAVNPINYVNPTNPRPKCSTSIISGNDNAQTICLTLKNHGYSNPAIAGVMGNMQAESGGFRTNNPNSIGCNGIVQWCFGRLNNLKSTYGSNWDNINSQIEYVLYELNHGYKNVNNYLMEEHNEQDMAYYFCMHYEIPGKSICENGIRQKNASNFMNYIQNGCQ